MKLARMIIAVACLLGFAAALQASTCKANLPETTPTSAFTDNLDGTVTHIRTGLMWKHCAEGQTWSGSTCTGSASPFTWSNALLAGRNAVTANHSDWRLPNLKELESIVESKCYGPSINASVFPNTPASKVWSASAFISDYAWYVSFFEGSADSYPKNYSYQVRLVRAGQSFGAFDALKSIPGAPTIVSITPGPGRLTLTLQAPGNTGGGAIVSYSATCSASGHPSVTATSTTTTVVVSGLVPGVSYACTATASNGSYTSLATPATSAVPKPKADLTPILMLLLD